MQASPRLLYEIMKIFLVFFIKWTVLLESWSLCASLALPFFLCSGFLFEGVVWGVMWIGLYEVCIFTALQLASSLMRLF